MIGYSEVIQTMAAMIIFSIIIMNANSLVHRNTTIQIEGELEQEVITLAQEIIDEARSKSFDRVVVGAAAPPADIPGDFTAPGQLGPDAGETAREHFDDFDDFHGYQETISTSHGDFSVAVEVYYVDPVNFQFTGSRSTFKKISVTVTSEFLRRGGEPRTYHLEFIRNYYAD